MQFSLARNSTQHVEANHVPWSPCRQVRHSAWQSSSLLVTRAFQFKNLQLQAAGSAFYLANKSRIKAGLSLFSTVLQRFIVVNKRFKRCFFYLFSWNLYTYIADHALTVKQWWWWMCDSIWSASYPAANAFYIFPATAAAATIYLFLKRKNTSTCTCPSSLSKNSSKNSTEEETFIKVPSKSFSDQQSEDFHVICTWFYKRHG